MSFPQDVSSGFGVDEDALRKLLLELLFRLPFFARDALAATSVISTLRTPFRGPRIAQFLPLRWRHSGFPRMCGCEWGHIFYITTEGWGEWIRVSGI